MNSTLIEAMQQAEGRYLNDQELQPLEQYLESYQARHQAYQLLRDNAEVLVHRALRRLNQTHRRAVQEYGAKCKRDMDYALSYVAKSVLSNEAKGFREDFALWMENITRALHKGESSAQAYTYLKQEVQEALPSTCAELVTPFIDDLITAFSEGQA